MKSLCPVTQTRFWRSRRLDDRARKIADAVHIPIANEALFGEGSAFFIRSLLGCKRRRLLNMRIVEGAYHVLHKFLSISLARPLFRHLAPPPHHHEAV